MTDEIKYLRLLSEKFPTLQSAYSEILNLNAILNLPKGTEHFITDLHGAYDAFSHFIKNGSGVISSKIDDAFEDELTLDEKQRLAILICYPNEIMEKYQQRLSYQDFDSYIEINLRRMIDVCRVVASKYTKSKVRKALPVEYAYIIEELLYETQKDNKSSYYESIIEKMIELDRGMNFIVALSKVISRLTIDHLHIVGDIYDRGAYPDRIIDSLMEYHNVDIQWGNHDVLWMGAASGSELCIANVIRISARYNLLNVLTDGYGINLLPLIQFAEKTYTHDYEPFIKLDEGENVILSAKIQKAMAVIQFKLEKEVFDRHPEFELDDRLKLGSIKDGFVIVDGEKHPLNSKHFPTGFTFELTTEEEQVIEKLKDTFETNTRLHEHVRFLFSHGSMYKKYNGNLLIHGCIPLNENGSFMTLRIDGVDYSGKGLLDKLEEKIRSAYFEDKHNNDYFVYLWQGKASPLFGKTEMRTFERCFLDNQDLWNEPNNPYFDLRENETILKRIFDEFELDFDKSKMINGHIPIKASSGESPIKANGKILSIDGGLNKSMSKATGIGGYTLRFNSYGLVLVAHQSFTSINHILETETDIISDIQFTEEVSIRRYIKDTDIGIKINEQIENLERLIHAYQSGLINEKRL